MDVPAVARFCLGRFWRIATPPQQQEFTKLFNQVIDHRDRRPPRRLQGRVVHHRPRRADPVRHVRRDHLNRPGNPPAHVQWVISGTSGAPKIVDVVAEGTSLRLTQRSDYASFMANNGNNVQTLIEALRRQVASAG